MAKSGFKPQNTRRGFLNHSTTEEVDNGDGNDYDDDDDDGRDMTLVFRLQRCCYTRDVVYLYCIDAASVCYTVAGFFSCTSNV